MKTALVITVMNEEDTLPLLLDSILDLNCHPDETIIVDGGSSDSSVEVVRSYADRIPGLRVLHAEGSNISAGRNRGIESTDAHIIATTDAGCRLHPSWFSEMTQPLNHDATVGMVCGNVKSLNLTSFQECVGACSLSFRLKTPYGSFFPTARTLAFRRDVWTETGGFPEKLDIGEDAVFISKALDLETKTAVIEHAVVFWEPRDSYKAVFKQFLRYAEGIAIAGLSPIYHTRTLLYDVAGTLFLLGGILYKNAILLSCLGALLGFYIYRKTREGCFSIPGFKTYYRIPLLLITIHSATLAGIVAGNVKRLVSR